VHYVIADVGTSFLNQNTLRLSRSATSLGDNLTGKFVAKWIPLPKSFRLSYLTPPLPLLVFALSMDEGVASSCASSSSRERQRYQGDAPTTPEHSNVVDITDTFHRLDLQGTPKSSRHDHET